MIVKDENTYIEILQYMKTVKDLLEESDITDSEIQEFYTFSNRILEIARNVKSEIATGCAY